MLAYGIDDITGGFMIHTSLVLQSVLGLMLLSVQAPTALGEERVRGSLDVLMAAPISTRAIVWGKWLGTYRVALWLAVLPGVSAALIAATSPDVSPRFKVRLGRDLARAGRPGRSHDRPRAGRRRIALVGRRLHQPGAAPGDLDPPDRPRHRYQRRPVPVALLRLDVPGRVRHLAGIAPVLYGRYNIHGVDLIWIDQGLVALSPVAAPITTIEALDIAYAGRWQFWAIMSFWCLLAWTFAGAMYWIALRSFDDRLGRMPETSQEAADAELTLLRSPVAGFVHIRSKKKICGKSRPETISSAGMIMGKTNVFP